MTGNDIPAERSYSKDLGELYAKFNADKGKVRLLMLLSPTCPPCLWGASEVQSKTLAQITDQDLRIFSVWVPILKSDTQESISQAALQLTDDRVSQFWDAEGELAKKFSRIMQLGEGQPAWDVYFVFNRDAEWLSQPPVPDFWLHQLNLAPEKRFDIAPDKRFEADRLTAEINRFLNVRGSR